MVSTCALFLWHFADSLIKHAIGILGVKKNEPQKVMRKGIKTHLEKCLGKTRGRGDHGPSVLATSKDGALLSATVRSCL